MSRRSPFVAIDMPTAVAALLAAAIVAPVTVPAAEPPDSLAAGFENPPNAARPRVWWHWMNGNITQEGIAKDLDWMKSVGIGGLQNFDANLATPQVVKDRLVFMTPAWQEAFRFAARKADENGLELAIAASPGWSETGGPWVPPADAMKKLVWSELLVDDGRPLVGALPLPPAVTGPFQSLPATDELAAFGSGATAEAPRWYADALVLAMPAPNASAPLPAPEVRLPGQAPMPGTALVDDDLESGIEIPVGTRDAPGTLPIALPAPATVRAASLFIPKALPFFGHAAFEPVLEARVDGEWRVIARLPSRLVSTTVSFAPVKASEFRVVLGPNTARPRPGLGSGAPGAVAINFFASDTSKVKVTELRLWTEPRVDRFESKAGFAVETDYYALEDAGPADEKGVAPSAVFDLTSRLRPDGSLDWTPPAGRWRVLRFGYSLTGKTNHPASAEATGLEVDKFDGAAVRRYLEHYLKMYRETLGGDFREKGLRALLTDSIEVGAANWTPRMVERFKALRGYDPVPWLPTLAGVIVGSRQQSDAFLYDFRRTLADLMAAEHYATVAAVAHEQGLKLYGEALEDQRPVLGDDLTMRARADVPMAAMWSYGAEGARTTLLGDIKGAASVAHVFGQNLVAAESLTAANSPWAFAPADLRPMIDLEFAWGVNRPVIHTSVHQPLDDLQPGLSLAIFGQYFNRHDTWASMAKPWVDYLSRSSYLLQQGRYFADVAYFHGEEAPLTALYGFETLPDTPKQHAWDFVNAEMLDGQLELRDGMLMAKSGVSYRVLYLGGTSARMTVPTLRRIAALVDSGLTLVGEAPTRSPALGGDPAEFAAIVTRLWPEKGGARNVGKGRVVATRQLDEALSQLGIEPDFAVDGAQADSEVLFVHRRLSEGDIYFVNNRLARTENVEARFRVTGRRPELWRADTGAVEPLSYRIENGHTVVPLKFAPRDSFFVVFREATTATSRAAPNKQQKTIRILSAPWQVAFQPGRGAPAAVTFAALAGLEQSTEAGIRHFSGIATYTTTFKAPPKPRKGEALLLDLGQVGDVAEVRLNGVPVGIVWKAPYRLDIGGALKAGNNQLEVRVANLWVNRLIGDAQPGATKVAATPAPTYLPTAPLRPSGLMGPVSLVEER